jgi:hypothetical protein
MIKKFFLVIVSILILNSCSIDSIVALTQLDKIEQVQHNSYITKYQGYFARRNLHPISYGHKFLYLYNHRARKFAILLHPNDRYVAYSVASNSRKIMDLKSGGYRYAIRLLKRYGYRRVTPSQVGYKVHIARRVFKGHKTYLLSITNYQKLIYRYKQAIKTYNYKRVKYIRTKLPKELIRGYFNRYRVKASTRYEREQISLIGIKLGIIKSRKTAHSISKKEDKKPLANIKKDREHPIIKPTTPTVKEKPKSLYERYSKVTSYSTLHRFLISKEAKESLTYAEFSRLKYKEAKLQERELLAHGTIEELIAQYKKTNNPRYKSKAMELMKNIKTRDKG